jgi:hypothetical protein
LRGRNDGHRRAGSSITYTLLAAHGTPLVLKWIIAT